ncbi:putative GprK-type G-protein coupled receptor protein [Xylariomycetidae sp. FL0641]|nr:putative GprK-type G-protein coupled receptor protein [Xylariomycetidae sp. FL0641]
MADPTAGLTIYNLPTIPPRYDAVGIFFITYACAWSALVVSGMIFLIVNRQNPILRVRCLGLSLTGIAFLHAYWILAQVTYPVGLSVPIVLAYDIQYFFMGYWFPLGIGLFHASNLHFLHVAKMQRLYAHSDTRIQLGCNGASTSWLCRFRNMSYLKRVLTITGFFLIIQVLLDTATWLAVRKYHPAYGIPGTEIRSKTLQGQIIELGQGWEWIPSALWQVCWTWIVAPVLIWRSSGIRDTLGWRFQTIACCVSGLHATPMWLIASYSPAFYEINLYFTPSQWIHLSTMFFEIFTIFVPCGLVIKHEYMRRRAEASNAKWETASQTMTIRTSASLEWNNSASIAEKGSATDLLDEDLGDRLMTMSALNHVLQENPGPLQEFSAMRDFSGENVAFLTRTARWKASWPRHPSENDIRRLFTQALGIYTDFISPRDAEFPVNLSSPDLKRLERIFEKPARVLLGDDARVNPATPFDSAEFFGPSPRPRRAASVSSSSSSSLECGSDTTTTTTTRVDASDLGDRVLYTGDVAEEFCPAVLDDALGHVKYLVLTNTWPKFVSASQRERRSGETERSGDTETSQVSLASRISNLIYSVRRGSW